MSERVLIVDDEIDIVNMVKEFFFLRGYQTITATSGQEALKKVEAQPDIILLDINMPDIDGITVIKMIREHISCPILFLTASVEDADKIRGFAAGADDYIVKPFSLEELGARVAAHLRRELRRRSAAKLNFDGDFVIDYSERAVFFKNKQIPLAKKEFDIVELLSQNTGQVFDKERIYERIWGYDSEGESTVVAEHIRRIRAKFAENGTRPYVQTVWGVGYKWARQG
ncbi:MAG: response regulator transcription factor [Oscillospiraceae bacterium]|nr:response regulator transcription factor [Oscillospiraceae bacterium]